MRTALITVAHQRHQHLRRQQEQVARSTVRPDEYVVVAMDDQLLARDVAAEGRSCVAHLERGEHGLPVAAARNRGASMALERGAELLVFLDVDCLPAPGLVAAYQRAAAHPVHGETLLSGPVAYLPPPPASGYDPATLDRHPRHPVRPAPGAGELLAGGDPRLFWSLSFALTAAAWERVGGFCPAYQGYGGEDTDFAYSAAAAGVTLTWVGGADSYHQWHPTASPPVQHLDDILRNAAVFASRWGWWPMEGWIEQFVSQGLIRWDDRADAYVRTTEREELVR